MILARTIDYGFPSSNAFMLPSACVPTACQSLLRRLHKKPALYNNNDYLKKIASAAKWVHPHGILVYNTLRRCFLHFPPDRDSTSLSPLNAVLLAEFAHSLFIIYYDVRECYHTSMLLFSVRDMRWCGLVRCGIQCVQDLELMPDPYPLLSGCPDYVPRDYETGRDSDNTVLTNIQERVWHHVTKQCPWPFLPMCADSDTKQKVFLCRTVEYRSSYGNCFLQPSCYHALTF